MATFLASEFWRLIFKLHKNVDFLNLNLNLQEYKFRACMIKKNVGNKTRSRKQTLIYYLCFKSESENHVLTFSFP